MPEPDEKCQGHPPAPSSQGTGAIAAFCDSTTALRYARRDASDCLESADDSKGLESEQMPTAASPSVNQVSRYSSVGLSPGALVLAGSARERVVGGDAGSESVATALVLQ